MEKTLYDLEKIRLKISPIFFRLIVSVFIVGILSGSSFGDEYADNFFKVIALWIIVYGFISYLGYYYYHSHNLGLISVLAIICALLIYVLITSLDILGVLAAVFLAVGGIVLDVWNVLQYFRLRKQLVLADVSIRRMTRAERKKEELKLHLGSYADDSVSADEQSEEAKR